MAAYGPTSPLAETNQEIRESFCDNRTTAWNTAKRRALVLCAGDFNSKLGAEAAPCVGHNAKGKWNDNSDALVLLTNTLFRYSQRYSTTLTDFVSDAHRALGTPRPVYNMSDCIIVPEVCRPLVSRALSYSGTTLSNDHKLVIGYLSS